LALIVLLVIAHDHHHGHSHDHDHDHSHGHGHGHDHSHNKVTVVEDVVVGDGAAVKEDPEFYFDDEDLDKYDEEPGLPQELLDIPGGVFIAGYSPDVVDGKFTIGKPFQVLFGLWNIAHEALNISSIGTHIVHGKDHSYVMRNYTRRTVDQPVPKGQQVTSEYRFLVDTNMDAIEVMVVTDVIYVLGEQEFVHANAFNITVKLLEGVYEWNVVDLFSYALFLVILGAVGYILTTVCSASAKNKSGVSSQADKKGTRTDESDLMDYVGDNVIKPRSPKESPRASPKASPKPSPKASSKKMD